MSSGGGGNGGITRVDWNDVIGGYYGGKPGPDGKGGGGWLGEAEKVASTPYQSYGNRIASRNNDQFTAAQRVRDMGNTGGPYETAIARSAAGTIAAGGGIQANPYMGDSPYFRDMMKSGMEDITNAYQKGTAAQTNRDANLAGVFGGGAYNNAVNDNQAALGKQLSQYAQGMQNQQYDRSGNLYEAGLNRQMSAIPLAFQGQGLQNDLNDRLMGVGKWEQDEQQKYQDQGYNDWVQQQNWGRGNVDWMLGNINRAMGGTGITQTQAGYQPTNWGSAALGAGLLGRAGGLF